MPLHGKVSSSRRAFPRKASQTTCSVETNAMRAGRYGPTENIYEEVRPAENLLE